MNIEKNYLVGIQKPREIIILDGTNVPSPPDMAMIQALYSRNPRSIREHVDKVKEVGSGKFLEQFYVGYGHKSIGDCGTTTICVEQVSMLCVKAIQHWPLYNGQEASTRYLDFSEMPIINPLGTDKGKSIQERWISLYTRALEVLMKDLKIRFPFKDEYSPSDYEKTIKTRAFDIARGFLPAGMSTMVSWHTNLRQAADHLKILLLHPLEEVRFTADEIFTALKERYSNSFGQKVYDDEQAYISLCQRLVAYQELIIDRRLAKFDLDQYKILKFRTLFDSRPPKSELPNELRSCGSVNFQFPLDFGSFRDLQRQRSMVCTMPILTTRIGFHPWYISQLPESFRKEASEEILAIRVKISSLDADRFVRQYYIAMGYCVGVEINCNLPSAVYIAELRSGVTVHPTLRTIAQWMGYELEVRGIRMHHDRSEDTFSCKRGKQDIVEKKPS